MISPNLHDIWAMFFLILSRYEKLVLLMLLRTSGDGSKKYPPWHNIYPLHGFLLIFVDKRNSLRFQIH
jgi:hypothetical protein